MCKDEFNLKQNVPQLTEASDEEEEDEEAEVEDLDEEAQMMASMGLPLAFASSSDQRRAVSRSLQHHVCVVIYCLS